MEFDKSKVFTPFNCSEVKIGSKGYVSDYYECLEDYVKDEFTTISKFGTLVYNDGKFQLENDNTTYQLFYLVEEPKEKTKRPCTRGELIKMLRKQGLPMLKHLSNVVRTVISIHQENVFDEVGAMSYLELCNQYTLLDGTELWVEE